MVAPLDGIRVVEVASWLAAPGAGALMADLGADVIKVEPPEGDPYRHFALGLLGFDHEFEINYAFELDNRGKRSVTVALDRPGGPEVVRRLCESADILLTNLFGSRRKRYGLMPAALHAANPRLVYASVTGYGSEGPDADRPGFDIAAFWARAGSMALLGEPSSPPPPCRGGHGDHTATLNLLAAVMVALRLRDQTGEGQLVEVSLLGTGAWTLGTDLAAALVAGQQPLRHDRTQPINPLWNSYRCADGRWVMLVMPQPDRYWPRFCQMLGRSGWATDPRYATLEGRRERSRELTREINTVFAAADVATWAERLDAAGMIWAPVAELPEVIRDPQLRSQKAFAPVVHPVAGRFETLAAPFHIGGADVAVRGPAPSPGEHTHEVLSGLGLSDDELADLAENGVLG